MFLSMLRWEATMSEQLSERQVVTRAIIAALDDACLHDRPPLDQEWTRGTMENVLTDDEGEPRLTICQITDVVLAALGGNG